MENRPAFELKGFLIAYNALLIVFNIWLTSLVRVTLIELVQIDYLATISIIDKKCDHFQAAKIDFTALIRSNGCRLQTHRLTKDDSLETPADEQIHIVKDIRRYFPIEFTYTFFFVSLFIFIHPSFLRLTLQLSTAAWWYFFSKIIELIDTVRYNGKKKNRIKDFATCRELRHL